MAATGVLGSRLSISTVPIAASIASEADFVAVAWREIGLIESIGEFGRAFDRVVFQAVDRGRTYKFKGGYDDGSMQVTVGEDLTTAGTTSDMAIPAYFSPGPLWTQSTSASPGVGGYMIMNPASGPGVSSDPAYVSAVNAAIAAGVLVIGYVTSSYTVKTEADVKTEIDDYKAWYGVSGIFLDEVTGSPTDVIYYQDIADYIRATAGTYVVLNPGAIPDESYMSIGDSVVVFEGSYAAYLSWTPPSWAANHPGKTTHLVYGVSSTNLMTVFNLSQLRHADNVFVTDDVLPNPWDTLPAYWDAELDLMGGGSAGGQSVLKAAANSSNQDNYGFRLVLGDGGVFYLRGLVMGFHTIMGSVNSVIKASATIEVNSPIVYVPG